MCLPPPVLTRHCRQAPGLMVMSGSGEPSVAASFQIRGINSLSSGTSPLFILDGVPVSSADFNTLNPSDIESISVLKDASSTSIYGARKRCSGDCNETRSGPGQGESDVPHPTGYFPTGSGQWNQMNTEERILLRRK